MLFSKKKPPVGWPTFTTQRLLLRPYQRQDVPAVWEVLRSPEIYATTAYIPQNITQNQVFAWIEHIRRAAQEETSLELGIFSRADGTYLGNVGLINLSAYHRSAEISYFIHPDHWGKGYATEAAAELLRYGFVARNYYRIAGTCMSRNPASQRVMEKLGFQVEGVARGELWKDGQFLDVTHLALLRSEWEAPRR